MPRHPRFCPAGLPVHVIQRGNDRQAMFTSEVDLAAYAHWLAEGAARFEVHVHGWVFMTNHVHLLMTPLGEGAVSRLVQYLGRLYVRYFNDAYSRSGTLFEGRFRSSVVQEETYFFVCMRYIELNPLRAGLVTDPGDYRWSSYRTHAFGLASRIWQPHPLYLSLGSSAAERQAAYRALVREALDVDVIARIRHCANSGMALGSDGFRRRLGRGQSKGSE